MNKKIWLNGCVQKHVYSQHFNDSGDIASTGAIENALNVKKTTDFVGIQQTTNIQEYTHKSDLDLFNLKVIT